MTDKEFHKWISEYNWNQERGEVVITAKQLRDKLESDLKALQETCEHPSTATWYHMPGHSMGVLVDVCDICEKVIK